MRQIQAANSLFGNHPIFQMIYNHFALGTSLQMQLMILFMVFFSVDEQQQRLQGENRNPRLLPYFHIWYLSLTLLALFGSNLRFRSQRQTNTAASLRVKNCPNSFILNKMISVDALLAVAGQLALLIVSGRNVLSSRCYKVSSQTVKHAVRGH